MEAPNVYPPHDFDANLSYPCVFFFVIFCLFLFLQRSPGSSGFAIGSNDVSLPFSSFPTLDLLSERKVEMSATLEKVGPFIV